MAEGEALTQGWNATNVETLKTNIANTFDELQAKTDMLNEIYTTVTDCWKGPDADAYLKAVYEKTKALIEEVKSAYDKIDGEIDGVAQDWDKYQNSNVDNASSL